MQDEISVTWEANRRRIREQNALAGQLVEALALFHAARYRPHSRLLSAYVTTQGRFPRWSSSIKRAWQLLKEGYDIDGSHRFVHYPDVAVEGLFSAESAIHDIHAWAIQIPDSFWRSQALVSYGVFGLGIFLKGKHKPSTRPALALVWRRIIVWFTLDPLLPASLYKLSLAYNDLGQTKNALAVLKKAIALAPYYPLLHDGLGNAFADLGQIEDAIAAYKLAIALDPYFSSPHYNLGLLYLDLGQIEDAIAAFKQAIALDPNDASPHNNLGTAYHKLGQTKDAIAAFKQAITLDPKNASHHNNLGNDYLDHGQ
jgi:tetratricopeptide (TPR) repeat protein